MKEYFELFWTFSKMGAVSFGGGYAMLPLIQRELVDKRAWVTRDEILDYFAIGQSTPGIIAINVSSFIGYRRKGWRGSVFTTLGFVLPSLIIITILAGILDRVSDQVMVQHAFAGIRIVVAALILETLMKFFKGAVKDVWGLVIGILAFTVSAVFSASPVLVVISAALAGLFLYRPKKNQDPPSQDKNSQDVNSHEGEEK